MTRIALAAMTTGLALAVCASVGTADLSIGEFTVAPRLDVRALGGASVPDRFHLMQAELDVRITINRDGEELVALALGPNLYTDMSGRTRQMHFGNYYSVWNFGVERPKLKLGQFVIPFGTLAEYDTHPLVLQTPYARTLGIRIDRGLTLEGAAGGTDWQVAVTSGDGRGRIDRSYAAMMRLARDYERGNDSFRVGLSLLRGANMPVFPVTPLPLPEEHSAHAAPSAMDLPRADKERLAVDLDWLRGRDNIRAELVIGRDDGAFVNGQWLQWNRPFSYNTDLTLQADRWQQEHGLVLGFGASLHHRLDDFSGVSLTYEPRWAYPHHGPAESVGLVTLQYYRNFERLSF